MISDLKSSQPLMRQITKEIRSRLPNATAVVFFGSRVAGVADTFSDYDVLVLLPEGLDSDERQRVKQEIQSVFPEICLDMIFGSKRWLLSSLAVEAYYRFWLENSVATFGQVPKPQQYPRLYKDAIDSRLNIIRSEIKVVEAWSRNLHQEAKGYLRILKHLVLIEHALQGNYSTPSIWNELTCLLGSDLISILRDPHAIRRVRRPMLSQVRRVMWRKFAKVRKQVLRSKLPSKYPVREHIRT